MSAGVNPLAIFSVAINFIRGFVGASKGLLFVGLEWVGFAVQTSSLLMVPSNGSIHRLLCEDSLIWPWLNFNLGENIVGKH